MIEKLPYKLSDGVTAIRAGLVFDDSDLAMMVAGDDPDNFMEYKYDCCSLIVGWPLAAEQLRYREGELWCEASGGLIICFQKRDKSANHKLHRLAAMHRLAAILCDDAEAFCILNWCVNNLSGLYW